MLTDAERKAIAPLLILHDSQLDEVPVRRYLEACEKVERMIERAAPSLICPLER